MHKVLRYAGQVTLYALFAGTLAYCSTSPRYEALERGQALLRVSFSHPGRITADCRKPTAEELAKLPANMRAPLVCPRERSPVVVRVELDGTELYHESFPPAGLARDGAATGYHRLPIPAGPHRIRVQFNDDVRVAGYTHEREASIVATAGQVVLIDFAPDRGGIIIR